MKISYRREMKHNYLVVEPDNSREEGYEGRMLSANHIPGLLRMRIKYQEGQPFYYYDITSRQPLNRLLETRFITRDEICLLLIQLRSALTGMEEFFLREDGILLEPEYVYVEPELFQAGLCLVPGEEGDFQERLSRFLQYILKRVNHRDRECVVLAYGLYQESLKENFSMEDLLRLTAPEGSRERTALQEENTGDWAQGTHLEREEDIPGGRDRIQEAEEGLAPTPSHTQRPRLPLKKQLLFWLWAALIPPVLLWGLKGRDALLELKYVLLGADAGLLALIVLGDLLILTLGREQGRDRQRHTPEGQGEDNPWRILYEDEEKEPPPAPEPSGISPAPPVSEAQHRSPRPGAGDAPPACPGPATSQLCEKTEEAFQTALLSDDPSGNQHRLISLQPPWEDISIPYYPFVIGKHKDLADYVLEKDTVSRFHLRIDRDGERFLAADLNSTNGTKVNNRLLEANDTAEIKPGDEIFIADIGYRFS